MAVGLVTITKEIDGEQWSNVYAVGTDGSLNETISVDDMITIGANQPITDDTTNPAHLDYLGNTFILHALLGFERAVHFQPVSFTNIAVTDGVKGSSVFAVIPLSFSGIRSTSGGGVESIMPGNVTLLVNKTPNSFAVKSGRSFYRAVLFDGAVKFGGKWGIDWESDAMKVSFQGTFATAVTDSNLDQYMSGGTSTASQVFAIPHYAVRTASNAGDLVSGTAITNLVVQRPVSRQMARGRKRSA